MSRPGVVVTSRADAPPRSAPTDVGMAFMVGTTEKGADVKEVRSLAQYEAEFGVRAGFTDAYDAAETFFREGGAKLTVARLAAGAGLFAAPADVPEGTVGEVLSWVGEDPDRANAAIAAEQGTDSPRTTLLEQLNATAGNGGGVSTFAAATTLDDALDRFVRSMGPGQVFFPGADGQDAGAYASLLAHAAATNRVALLDAAPDEDAAGLVAAAEALRTGNPDTARYGALFAPAAVIPGLTSADTRTVPFSAVAAGIMARNDAAFTPNVASAGVNGQARTVIDFTAVFTDAEREDLNDAGVDVAKMVYGAPRLYGYRTLADLESGWGLLSNARLNMEIVARAEEVGERYLFTQIDGRRVTISAFGSDLTGMLVPYYDAGALFGDTVSQAFYVDVGAQVNTLETIAAGDLRAVIGLRMSPFAEWVLIEIVKVATETPLTVAA